MSQLRTMRSRLVRIMLIISGLTGTATFATVAVLSAQTSTRHLGAIQEHIEDGIASKGKVLTHNHALAMRSLILDNAFTDIQGLIERAVREDADVAYGLFVSAEQETLAASRRDRVLGVGESQAEPPARDAWRELGLTAEELLVRRESVRRVQRLGQDLLEVAVPVTDDGGQMLGTLRYALSTRHMHEALERARADKSAGLLKSVLWIAGLVSLTTLIGWLLSRLQAVRITRPVGELTQAARDLAAGKRSVRVTITSGDELELLGSSFNHMVEELDVSYRELENMNRTLEQKVDARTLELAQKNRDMRLVLDNVDQGFLTLSRDGRVTGGRSRVVSEWFGPCQDQAAFAAYIEATSPAFAMAFDCGWSQVVDGILPLELTIDQLPPRLVANGRTWSFRYLPFMEGDQVEGVLVVAAEITERLARDREEGEQRELMQIFTRLMRDRKGFSSFLRDAERMVAGICSRKLDQHSVVLKSTLHTLKGNAASMGLSVIAAHCHALEEQLQGGEGARDDGLLALSEGWARINEHVRQLTPSETQRTLEVTESDYTELITRLSQDPAHVDLLTQVRRWALEPAARPLARLADQAQTLARRLGKGELEVVVQAGGVRLDAELWAPFFSELIHLIRNAVDHGIEDLAERRRRGKPARGRLVLAARTVDDALELEVSDDGRGIDWDLIESKAEALGLAHATPSERLAVLCHAGISSRAEVSETSGRGMGMAAFQYRVDRMGGRIDVESSELGTRWFIRFPARVSASSSQRPGALPPWGSPSPDLQRVAS